MTAALAISSSRWRRRMICSAIRPKEIGEVRDGIAQLLEQGGIEFMALERGERMGIEADCAVELVQTVAHPADDLNEQRGRRERDFGERVAPDSQGGHGRAGAGGGGTGQLGERAEFSDQRGPPSASKPGSC